MRGAVPLCCAAQERFGQQAQLLLAWIMPGQIGFVGEAEGFSLRCPNKLAVDGISAREARDGCWIFYANDKSCVQRLRSNTVAAG